MGSLEGAALAGSWGIIPAYRPYLESPLFLKAKSPIFGDWLFNEFWAEQEEELSLEFFRPAGWGAVNAIVGTGNAAHPHGRGLCGRGDAADRRPGHARL